MAARQAELTQRLGLLISVLEDEAPHREPPPDDAAATWTEAAVRRYFATGEAPAEFVTAQAPAGSQPGGGRPQPQPVGTPPTALVAAQERLTVPLYHSTVLAAGLLPRPNGLFPPGDPVLGRLASDTTIAPFEKHLLDPDGVLVRPLYSFPVGDDACEGRGIDLRCFFATAPPRPREAAAGARLLAAVRFGDRAAIGAACFTSTHGGAIETAFDEATAELCKITVSPLASTIAFEAAIKKPVPAHTSLLLECVLESVAGLRLNTSATLKDGAGQLLASCKAQLVDIGELNRQNKRPSS